MRSEKEIREEVRRVRERVKGFSGFWIGEASAGIYALEWALGRRDLAPSEDLGRAGGERERIAAALLRVVRKAPRPRLPRVTSRPVQKKRGSKPPASRKKR